MKLQKKIYFYFLTFIFLFFTAIYILNYSVIRNVLQNIAREELKKQAESIYHSVEIQLNTAVENYLKGLTDSQITAINSYYSKQQKGIYSEKEAKNAYQRYCIKQKVGKTGYIVALKKIKEKIILEIHPVLRNKDCAKNIGCQTWTKQKNGYNEYLWKNPNDENYREKVAYISYFKPWDWVVGSTSYKDEFVHLIKLEKLKQLINPIRFKKTGYCFIFNSSFDMLIHPELEGINFETLKNEDGIVLSKVIVNALGNFKKYKWKNPSENFSREKYVYVKKLKNFDWYLATSVYVEEVYEPAKRLEMYFLIVMIIASIVFALIAIFLSKNITNPLQHILIGINSFYKDDIPFNMKQKSVKEVQELGNAFEKLTHSLSDNMKELKLKIHELDISKDENDKVLKLLDNVINSMPSVLIGLDSKYNIIMWNNEAAKLVGTNFNKAYNNNVFNIFKQLQEKQILIEDSINKNEVKTDHKWIYKNDKTIDYKEITIYPLDIKGSKGAVIRIDDVSERIKIQEALQQSQKMDAIGNLSGGIAHDFNNMLAGIMSSAQLLDLKVKSDKSLKNYITTIRETAKKAADLTAKLLNFSRKTSLNMLPVHVHEAIQNAIDLLERSIDKKIKIIIKLESKEDVIIGDLVQLQNIFLNLGINAAHAQPNGGEIIFKTSKFNLLKIHCKENNFKIDPGKYLFIQIEDKGSGIPQENLNKIFDPFFTTKQLGEGTGLGLASVYGIIEQHKGAITVYSEINIGTKFNIYLPLSEDSVTHSEQKEIVTGSGTILLIDDEKIIRNTTNDLLTEIGYSVILAKDGEEGLNIFKENKEIIDIVIMDMIMPKMNGHECFKQLKKIDKNVKVIFSSGFSKDEDIKAVKEMGIADFISKPYDIINLSHILDKIKKQ